MESRNGATSSRGGRANANEALKRELATRYRDDRLSYTEAKTEFIEAALARAVRTDIG